MPRIVLIDQMPESKSTGIYGTLRVVQFGSNLLEVVRIDVDQLAFGNDNAALGA